MYCGVKNPPKGRERGTPEYCAERNQVRYYGIKKINKKLVRTEAGPAPSLIKEQLKSKKLMDDAKILVKDSKIVKIIMESDKSTNSEKKKAQKRLDELKGRRDRLIKRITQQTKKVNVMLEEEKAKKAKKSKKSR